jgi:hypothetical protein
MEKMKWRFQSPSETKSFTIVIYEKLTELMSVLRSGLSKVAGRKCTTNTLHLPSDFSRFALYS